MTARVVRLDARDVPAKLSERVTAEIRATIARRAIPATMLAEAVGISQSTMSKRLNNVQPLTFDFVDDVCEALGVDIVELLTGYPTAPVPPGAVKQRSSDYKTRTLTGHSSIRRDTRHLAPVAA